MAWWVYNQNTGQGTLDYPTLGFTAEVGDVLEADAAPDARWSSTGGGPETVTRYAVGSDPSYVEPGDGHVLTWSDAANTYVPTEPGRAFGGLLAEAFDESDSAWPFTVGSFASVYPGLTVTIPPVTRPVELEYHAYGKVSEVGVGIFGFTLWETTSGAGVDIGGNTTSLLDKSGVFEGLRHFHGSVEVQPLAVPAWRTFRLVGGVFRQSGTVGQAVTQSSGATKNRAAHLKAVLQ